ncbi:hypothetical protein MHH28_06830 [Paenibacillus sp. FSL K6-1217]|uniref:hypothetical protein n=1 Tax=Paenibacillus sp. FSL K6-1217 TaxID=2921466 RepID=UPI00324DB476
MKVFTPGHLQELAGELRRTYPFYNPYADVDFHQLPMTDKHLIAGNRALFEHPDARRVTESFTSGTTGVPFRCVKTPEEIWKLSLTLYKHRKKWGLPARHRMMLLSNRLLAEPRSLRHYAERMIREYPHFIQGRASALCALAEYMRDEGYSLPSSLLFTQNWGETLHGSQKERIEEVFRVPCVDYYGLEEFWCIAFAGPSGQLEIDESAVYVEIIDPASGLHVEEGEFGEVLVTSLIMRSLPYVRYRTGDIGSIRRDPETGRLLLGLLPVRTSQIRLPGVQVHSAVFRYLDKFFWELAAARGVRQFQIVQNTYTSFSVRLATEAPPSEFEDVQTKLSAFLHQAAGKPVKLSIETVSRLEADPVSGKIPSFVCRISSNEEGE